MLGKVAVERLVDQEKTNKQLSQESKELKRSFDLTQSANLDLDKKGGRIGGDSQGLSGREENC
jgi:hypothetical protein